MLWDLTNFHLKTKGTAFREWYLGYFLDISLDLITLTWLLNLKAILANTYTPPLSCPKILMRVEANRTFPLVLGLKMKHFYPYLCFLNSSAWYMSKEFCLLWRWGGLDLMKAVIVTFSKTLENWIPPNYRA